MQAASNAEEKHDRFAGMTDEEIVRIAQEEHDGKAADYIVNKYRNFVKSKARAYFLVGADRDDIIQEGMIGLYKATRFGGDISVNRSGPLPSCGRPADHHGYQDGDGRNTYPLTRVMCRHHGKPVYEDESDRTLQDILSGIRVSDPEELVISREEFNDIELKMNEILSDAEWQVLTAYLDGKSYNEMSRQLHRHVKSIDNALQRVKRKLEHYLETRNAEKETEPDEKAKEPIDRKAK